MHTINVRALTLPLLFEQFPAFLATSKLFETVERTGQSLALEYDFLEVKEQPIPESHSDAREPQRVPALLLVMAGIGPGTLLSLAKAMPAEYNENSADLRTSTTYLGWNAGAVQVRLNSWQLRSFPGNMDTRRLAVAFWSGEHAVVADHTLDADGMDCLMSGLQGAQGSSGPNYRPWRIWSEDMMLSHEGAEDVLEHDVHTLNVVRRGDFSSS